jgi:hypothetical protein
MFGRLDLSFNSNHGSLGPGKSDRQPFGPGFSLYWPTLYGNHNGFYREERIDRLHVSIRADLGIKALLAGEVDFIYSAGAAIRGAVQGFPSKLLASTSPKCFIPDVAA